jgi:16S rRNA G966 N2-methylase RsmD
MIDMLKQFRDHGIKTRILNPYDALWDRRLRVRTFGFHPAAGQQGDSDWRLHYTPAPYSDIFRLLKNVDLDRDDVFTDLGAGMGRAVFTASRMGARRAVGVEIVESLCKKALQNLQQSRLSGRDIAFICTDALNYRHDDTTVLFLFHPFGEATLRQVVRNLEIAQQNKHSRRLRVIYLNPVFDFVLQQSGWLECFDVAPASSPWLSTGRRYAATLWRAIKMS